MENDRHRVRSPHEFTDAEGFDGEQEPMGEDQGITARFSAEQIATAFGVDISRVYDAFEGEFRLGRDGVVDSRQAQDLAEVIIGDRQQGELEEALVSLGAYTPRRGTIAPSVSEKPPGELSDGLRPEGEHAREFRAPKEPDK